MLKKQVFLSLFALAFASLACTLFIGGPDYPATSIPVSTEAAQSVDEQLHQAATAAVQSGGGLTVSITESQITSLLAARLAEDPQPFLTEPQVYLRDGQIQIYGKAASGNFQANVRINLTASVDADGRPQLIVSSVDFGPLPAPEGMNSAISALVNEAFTGAFGPAATGFRLESIVIADGVMTLTGRIK